MALWLVFCSTMIAFICEALIREGFGKAFVVKVAAWSMLSALITALTLRPMPELDGRGRAQLASSGELNAWTSDQSGYNWRAVTTYRIKPTKPQELQQETTEASNQQEKGIDFMPICGAGERRIENRLDLAEIARKSDDQHC